MSSSRNSSKRPQVAEFRHGLEWRPCPASHSGSASPVAGTDVTAASNPSSCRTLVVLLPWMWAASTSVDKHVELYHALGCDVALYRWSALAVWLPLLAARNAVCLLHGLAAHLQMAAATVPAAGEEAEAEQAEAGTEAGEAGGSAHAWSSSDVWREAGWRTTGPASYGAGAPGCSGTDSKPRGSSGGFGGGGDGGGTTPRLPRRCRLRRPHVILVSYSGAAKGVLAPALERLVAAAESELGADAATAAAAAVAGRAGSSGGLSGSGSSSSTKGGAGAGPSASGRQPRQPQPPGGPVGAAERAVLAHLAGVVFDSGPVDFDSSVGVTLFANSKLAAVRELQRAAGNVAAGAMDFFLYEAFESQRRHMWRSLRTSLALLNPPTAFLFSWTGDGLADPQPIHALATALRTPAPPSYGQQQQQQQQDMGDGEAGAADGGGGAGGGGQQQQRSWARWAWDMAWAAVLPMSPFAHAPLSAAAATGALGQAAAGDAAAAAADGAGLGAAAAAAATPSPLAGLDFSGEADAALAASALGGAAAGPAGLEAAVAAGRRPRPLLLPAVDWVQEQGWAASAHVAHLRQHPEEYRAAVAAFLQRSEQH